VTLRYRLPHDPEHPFSEVSGVVQAAGDETVSVLSRRGRLVEVVIADVVTAKTIGPPRE
jgi:hypothetical protein